MDVGWGGGGGYKVTKCMPVFVRSCLCSGYKQTKTLLEEREKEHVGNPR